jgi:hypothetical protein
MAETFTNRGKLRLAETGINSKDFRMCVFTGTQTGVHDPDLNFVSELDAVTGVAIHAERIALTGEAATEDDTNNRVNIDAGDVTFAASPGTTAQGVAIYTEGANDAARELWAIYTTNFPQPMDGGLVVAIADWLRGA